MNSERMTKEELLKLIESLKIDSEEFTVISSSALVLRDIYDSAGDLDIAVTLKGLNQLKQNYNLIQKEINLKNSVKKRYCFWKKKAKKDRYFSMHNYSRIWN